MDGFELCRALKTHEKTCHIPVILLTAKTARDDRLHGLETGADCYLTKPFDALELLVQVRNLIDQRRQLRERFSAPVVLKPSEMGVTPMDEVFLTKVLTVGPKPSAGFDLRRRAPRPRGRPEPVATASQAARAHQPAADAAHSVDPPPARSGAAGAQDGIGGRGRLLRRLQQPGVLRQVFPRAVRMLAARVCAHPRGRHDGADDRPTEGPFGSLARAARPLPPRGHTEARLARSCGVLRAAVD